MPENEEQNVSVGEFPLFETDKQRFERERLTRRQALRKFGVTAGMATFAMFSVDDLARMVGKAMQQRAGDSKVATQLAKEFQSAGVAMADGTSGNTPCIHCCNQGCDDVNACLAARCSCIARNGAGCDANFNICRNNAYYAYYGCYAAHCGGGIQCPQCYTVVNC